MDATTGDRTWAALAHLSGCLWILGIPFGGSIATAIIYVTRRHDSPFVADQARESQNFQNTVSLAVIAAIVAVASIVEQLAVRRATEPALAAIALGAASLAVIMIANAALSIIAALAVQQGVAYRYPVSLRLLRDAKEHNRAR